jgi:feruloyl esterase
MSISAARVAGLALLSLAVTQDAVARHREPIACADLATQFHARDVLITSATEVPEVISGPTAAPAHCDVRGAISDNIKFAVFLPVEWNGRFQMVGNGGKAGSISIGDMRTALRLGYASSSTDTGHDASLPDEGGARFGNDALFGKEREIDFGWRAIHLTARASKDLIEKHYAKRARYSYWNGCSTGGRQGLMEAQRFPEDFDGYIIGAPVYNYTGQQMNAPALLRPLYTRIPPRPGMPADGPVLSAAKRNMLGAAVYSRCDALDGLVDGQLRNPLKCDFDPAVHIPVCSETSGTNCLTPNELAAVQEIYAGKEPFVPGVPLGSENIPGGWSTWILPNSPTGTPSLHSVIADAFEWLMFTPDRPGYDYLTQWDWNVEPFQMRLAEKIYNATDPDLREVRKRKSKILMYHGWHDPGANPVRSIRYREAVVDFMGKRDDDDDDDDDDRDRKRRSKGDRIVDSFLKLYLVPGMAHCGGGVGHSTVDWLTPLVDWVERRIEPHAIVGSRTVAGAASTRPHCPYPEEAVYDGVGNPNDAPSFSCEKVD